MPAAWREMCIAMEKPGNTKLSIGCLSCECRESPAALDDQLLLLARQKCGRACPCSSGWPRGPPMEKRGLFFSVQNAWPPVSPLLLEKTKNSSSLKKQKEISYCY